MTPMASALAQYAIEGLVARCTLCNSCGMTLSDYLARPDTNATELAARVGVSVSTITRAARGEVLPTRTVMQKLFNATGGSVTPNDFFGISA